MTPDGDDPDNAGEDRPAGTDDLTEMYDRSPAAGEPAGDTSPTGDDVDGDGPSVQVGEHSPDPETAAGTFYVKHAADVSVTLQEVDTGQIFTLTENPGFETHDIVEATLVAQPPMEVSYRVEELRASYSVPVEISPEPPTRQVQEVAAEMDETQAVAIEREGEGEIHVLRVAPDDVERTAAELHEDEMTCKNAARYGVRRVEVRTDESGTVSIRYLP